MPVSVKVGGVWKQATAVYNKVGGVWKTAADMPVKVAGVWKTGILVSGAFEPIATITASGGETSITFSSIPNTYKHLQVIYNGRRTTSSIGDMYLTFNGDGAANYDKHWVLSFDGQGPYQSVDNSSLSVGYLYGSDANVVNSGVINILEYSSASKNKTAYYFNGNEKTSGANGTSTLVMGSGQWRNTSAVTSLTLSCNAISAGSKFELYGIKG